MDLVAEEEGLKAGGEGLTAEGVGERLEAAVVRGRLGAKAASRLGLWEEAVEYRSRTCPFMVLSRCVVELGVGGV